MKAAEHFFSALRVHGRQLARQFIARSPFRITAPADAHREESRYYPNGDVSLGDHGMSSDDPQLGSPRDESVRLPDTAATTVNLGAAQS
jgi:hypothetical protein